MSSAYDSYWSRDYHDDTEGRVHLSGTRSVSQDAMKSEIESMKENQVWNLIDPPDGVRTIEFKWIYKKKKDMDGNIHIYKARLVAKGFWQGQGVDYDETFSPVAMLKSIRIILAIAS